MLGFENFFLWCSIMLHISCSSVSVVALGRRDVWRPPLEPSTLASAPSLSGKFSTPVDTVTLLSPQQRVCAAELGQKMAERRDNEVSCDYLYSPKLTISPLLKAPWISVFSTTNAWIKEFDFGECPHLFKILERQKTSHDQTWMKVKSTGKQSD